MFLWGAIEERAPGLGALLDVRSVIAFFESKLAKSEVACGDLGGTLDCDVALVGTESLLPADMSNSVFDFVA